MAAMIGSRWFDWKLRNDVLVLYLVFIQMMVANYAAIVDPTAHMRDDISRIKVMMESVGEQLDRFNGLYLSKLETRLLASATSLAHIDSNVRNLQERAHVWDTFQLHVSAWNEQIKSLDKKLDILSRGTEKFELLDEKVASLLPLEDKIQKMMAKLEETDSKVTEIQRKLNSASSSSSVASAASPASSVASEAPLFNEFTSRGVLSALKDIEIKVNKLVEKSTLADAPRPAEPATCHVAQQKTNDIVNDIAAKVDFILDKMVAKKHGKQTEDVTITEESMYDDNDDYSTVSITSANGDHVANQAERAFVKLWRRMLQPVRRANRKFESLDKMLIHLEKLANSSVQQHVMNRGRVADDKQIVGTIQHDVASLLQCCRANDAGVVALSKTFDNFISNFNANNTNDRCISQVELQHHLQQSRIDIVAEIRQLVIDQMDAAFDKIRHACTTAAATTTTSQPVARFNQRKKISNRDNSNETITSEEVTTETYRAKVSQSLAPSFEGEEDLSVSDKKSVDTIAKTTEAPVIRGCQDLRMAGERQSRVYTMASGKELNEGGRDYNTRFCDMTTDGGGWTTIQRRGDYGLPRENFSVYWRDYKLGFGDIEREFWFGNDYIHRLTNENDVVLRVELWDFNDTYVYADYESFRVDSEEDLYRLWIEGYHGNATDSLGSHNGYAFSTFDRDNDEAPPCCPCAPAYGGGWWFYSCFEANLNGEYHSNPTDNDYFRGIIWELWRGDYSLRKAEMKIRPHNFVPPPTTTTITPPTLADLEHPLGGEIPEDP